MGLRRPPCGRLRPIDPCCWASGGVPTLDRARDEQTLIPPPEQPAIPTPPERIALRDLEDGQRVRGVYAVRQRELRRKRNGEPWLRLSVGDATGAAEAVCWEDAEPRYA